jgi:hypothetical protein
VILDSEKNFPNKLEPAVLWFWNISIIGTSVVNKIKYPSNNDGIRLLTSQISLQRPEREREMYLIVQVVCGRLQDFSQQILLELNMAGKAGSKILNYYVLMRLIFNGYVLLHRQII